MKRLVFYISLIVITSVIYLLWEMKIFPPEIIKFFNNYGLHGLGSFGAVLFLGILQTYLYPKRWKLTLTISTIAVVIISTTSELLQFVDPSRVVDKYDFFFQLGGCAIAHVLILIVGPIKSQKAQR